MSRSSDLRRRIPGLLNPLPAIPDPNSRRGETRP